MSNYYLPEDSLALTEEERSEYNYQNDLFDDSYSKTVFKKQRFPFDPNTVSFDSILLLGFSKFAAKNLVNFRSKGGKIKDLQKLPNYIKKYGRKMVLHYLHIQKAKKKKFKKL